MINSFKDKVIWITGASSGIGEAMTYAFADQDAYLVISSRKENELQRVKANCKAPERIKIIPCDVAQFDTIPAVAEQAIAFQGHLDILVNNAGISQRARAAETIFEVDQKIMNVNYLGTVAITKAVIPHLRSRKSGQIVVISSVLGKMGVPFRSAYCASKHALHGFFDALRAELYQDNIDVTTICPGYVKTNVTINALTGDGSPNNEMAASTAAGYSPEEFVKKALKAIANKKKEAYFAKKELAGVYLNRFVPLVFFRMMRKFKLS
ncbi:MAG: SDR family oxidoreductase [Bacteroidota bacterium]